MFRLSYAPDYSGASGPYSYVGLCLATTTSSQNPYRVMGVDAGGWNADVEGGSLAGSSIGIDGSAMPAYSTQSLLTLARGTGANENLVTWTFSKIGGTGLSGTGNLAISGLGDSTGLYFGTAAISMSYGPQPTWDNLTYTAAVTTPEPGALVLLALGLFGLLAYAWRKRRCVPS